MPFHCLPDDVVMSSFQTIITKAAKKDKPEMQQAVEEWQSLIQDVNGAEVKRASEQARKRPRETGREREGERERGRERGREGERRRERERESVCVCEREREKGREGERDSKTTVKKNVIEEGWT